MNQLFSNLFEKQQLIFIEYVGFVVIKKSEQVNNLGGN